MFRRDLVSTLASLAKQMPEDARPGRFVLTASQNLLLMEPVSQTLAGRTAILRLLPLTLGELHGLPPVDVATLGTRREVPKRPEVGRWEALFAGFYPRIHQQGLDPTRWLGDYVRTYVERDLRQVLRVMDLDAFGVFLRLTAARTAQELNLSELATDAGITQPTAKAWLGALRIGSLITTLPPHHVNFRKRLRRRPKLHFLDTGLACWLLGIRNAATLAAHPHRGAIFESYVVGELVKAFENQGREASLYHWRDAGGRQLDVILDLGDRLVPVEAKSGATVADDAFDTPRWWRALPGNSNEEGLVVYGGNEASRRHCFAVRPWFSV